MRFKNVGPLGLWNLFDDGWIGTRRAAIWFVAATFLAVPVYAFMLGLVDPWHWQPSSRVVLNLLAIPGILSVFFVWLGMLRYWARRDASGRWSKRLWFVVLVGGFWYGGCLYCWFAYLPQVIRSEKGVVTVPVSRPVSRAVPFGRNLVIAWLVFFSAVTLVFAFPKFAASVPIVPILFVASMILVLTSFTSVLRWLYRQGVARK